MSVGEYRENKPGKRNQDQQDLVARLREGQKAALVTMVVSALLAISKGVFGTLSGAVILTADALDSSTDVITSLAAYLGIRMARRKPEQPSKPSAHPQMLTGKDR